MSHQHVDSQASHPHFASPAIFSAHFVVQESFVVAVMTGDPEIVLGTVVNADLVAVAEGTVSTVVSEARGTDMLAAAAVADSFPHAASAAAVAAEVAVVQAAAAALIAIVVAEAVVAQ